MTMDGAAGNHIVNVAGTVPGVEFRIRTRWRTPLALGVMFLVYQMFAAAAINGLGVHDARLQWDGEWYLSIAEFGYPSGGAPGVPPEGYDAYAFHPLYPMLLRVLGALPGLTSAGVAPWLNLVLATAAVVLFAWWMARTLGTLAAITAVVALTVWPSSPVFQLAYTEGLALFLLTLTWILVTEGRYGAAAVTIVALSFARPLVVPLSAAILVVALSRWWQTRDLHSLRGPAMVVVAAAVATVAWPIYAGFHSGDPRVYFAAHLAFAKPGAPTSPAALGMEHPQVGVLLLLLVALTTILGARLMPSGTPTILKAWVVLYPPYILVGSLVTPSLLRYFMLTFPASLCLLPVARQRWGAILLTMLALALAAAGILWWIPTFVPPVADGTYP